MDIKPYSKNAKQHPKKQIEQIANSIKAFGMNQPIVVDKEGVIIVGHGRYEALKLLGWEIKPEWIIKKEDLSEEQIKAYRLADNKLNESEWDMGLAIEELKGLSDEMFDLTGFDKDLLIEPDEKDDLIPDNAPPIAQLGDIWALGKHRVMCGDSTQQEAVLKLMEGKKADMVFTDPPYGMNLDTDYSKMPGTNTKYSKVIGDEKEFDISFLFSVLPSPVYYIWGAEYLYNTIPNFKQGSLAVWAKRQSAEENKVFGSAYELCWIFPKIKKEIWFVRSINQSSERLGSHPTQKPTELATRAITDRTEEDNIIADLFLGSGSTLIACEKTNRICYGMELDPKYVDVIIKRYEDYTNTKAIKL